MRKSIVTVLAALTASIAVPATAEEVSVTVAFGDLNLASPAGRATLDKRIAAAVNRVCAQAERRDLAGRMAWDECKAATLADAMEQLAAVLPSASVALAASPAN